MGLTWSSCSLINIHECCIPRLTALLCDFPLSFIDLPPHLALIAIELLVQGQLVLIDLPRGFLMLAQVRKRKRHGEETRNAAAFIREMRVINKNALQFD